MCGTGPTSLPASMPRQDAACASRRGGLIEGRDGLYLPTLERRGCLALPSPNQCVGLQLIIGYKLAKIPFVVALALWLTLARSSALVSLERLATDLSSSARWAHVSLKSAPHTSIVGSSPREPP